MDRSQHDALADQLRRAIAARDALRPGTVAHWRASCEARALMKRLSAEQPFTAVVAPQAPDGGVTAHHTAP